MEASQLRWRADESALDFKSTSEIDPAVGIVGQPVALEALRFGLECQAPGQNVYVRGLSGTGRMTMIRSVLDELNTLYVWGIQTGVTSQYSRCKVRPTSHRSKP